SEEHTSELQSRLVISYAVFCLKKKNEIRCHVPLPGGPASRRHNKEGFIATYVDADIQQQWLDYMDVSSFFFNDTATTEIYTTRHTLSLHDALPIWSHRRSGRGTTRAHQHQRRQ